MAALVDGLVGRVACALHGGGWSGILAANLTIASLLRLAADQAREKVYLRMENEQSEAHETPGMLEVESELPGGRPSILLGCTAEVEKARRRRAQGVAT